MQFILCSTLNTHSFTECQIAIKTYLLSALDTWHLSERVNVDQAQRSIVSPPSGQGYLGLRLDQPPSATETGCHLWELKKPRDWARPVVLRALWVTQLWAQQQPELGS